MNGSELLGKLFDELKAEKGISRAAFARNNKLPDGGNVNATMIYQHIKGIRPISMEYAYLYAKTFNIDISDISPEADKTFKLATKTKNIHFPPVNAELSDKTRPIQQLPPTFNNDTIYSISQLDEPSYKLLESVVVDFLNSDDEARKASNILVAGQKALSDQRNGAAKVKPTNQIQKGFSRAGVTRKEGA